MTGTVPSTGHGGTLALFSGTCSKFPIYNGMTLCEIRSQPSSTTKSRRLSLFADVARMDGKVDANQILFEPTLELWRRSLRQPHSPLPQEYHSWHALI